MPTEVWFRNPNNYIRELVECGVGNIAWDRGILVKKGIDPAKHADLFFGKTIPYRLLLVGAQGTAELRPGDTMQKPSAVYPTWTYGEELELLEEIMARPMGEDRQVCNDDSIEPDMRPVFGQEHRVVITDLPAANHGPTRKFLARLKELQEEYHDCIVHVHGLYSYRVAFGLGFRSADVEPRTSAQKGKLLMPSGREVLFEKVQGNAQWLTVLGFTPGDMTVPRNRCMYNIKSALWAGEHYGELFKFKATPSAGPIDTETPDGEFKPTETRSHLSVVKTKAQEGDKFHCDTCSLQNSCKYFRSGAVCTVPGAEPTSLARYFQTRDSGMILDGLGTLVAAQTRRLERGMQAEEDFGELDPEVTKLINAVFNQGVQLAKLVDPSMRGSAVKVNIGVGAGGAAQVVASSTPNELIGGVVRELEARGIPRDKITPDLIKSVLSASGDSTKTAIEGHIVNREAS